MLCSPSVHTLGVYMFQCAQPADEEVLGHIPTLAHIDIRVASDERCRLELAQASQRTVELEDVRCPRPAGKSSDLHAYTALAAGFGKTRGGWQCTSPMLTALAVRPGDCSKPSSGVCHLGAYTMASSMAILPETNDLVLDHT